ncbi:MAG: tetratricopeptide repeat protein [Candidatus Eisenbacteria bacterium]
MRQERTIAAGAILLALASPVFFLLNAYRVNGASSFPLDDPWIHLTYARNLALHHSFSYFPGDHTGGGSTAPLYTLLLSLGFLFTRHEKGLSFLLGLLFQGGFLAVSWLWARRKLGDAIWASAFVLLVGLDPRIGMLAISGMETSLFLFLIASAFWARAERRDRLFGLALGLAVWVRPDALILCGVFAIAGLLDRDASSRPEKLPTWAPALAVTLLLYFVFNLTTSGAILPNTFAAKHAYYVTPKLTFLKGDVRECFLSYSFWGLTPLFAIAAAREVGRLLSRKASLLRAELGWALGLTLAYLLLLPFAHRFGRYLAPALPAVALLGLSLLKDGAARLLGEGKKTAVRWNRPSGVAAGLVLLALVAIPLLSLGRSAAQYAGICEYHRDRHEKCGRWLKENTPPDAVIATHDVGAIAYYSERRVVDTVGLIQKDAIPHLHKEDYTRFLADFFDREKVTHVACLRNWLEVVNVHPIFVADPRPEVLEVFPWIPGRTHIVSEQVSAMNQRAAQLLKSNLPQALALVQRSLTADPDNGRSWMLLGATQELSGDPVGAEQSYRRGLSLAPDAEEVLYALGLLLARDGRKEEARGLLDRLTELNPKLPQLATLRAAVGS